MEHDTATRLIEDQVKTSFGNESSRAILVDQLDDYVIKQIWKNNISVLVFMQNNQLQKKTFAPGKNRMEIISPFDYNKFTQTSSWLHYLNLNYENRLHGNDKHNWRTFYVTQGIMQPHWMEVVVAGISGNASLRVWVSEHATREITHWLHGKRIGTAGINIVIADFVELQNFTDAVLTLNTFTNTFRNSSSVQNDSTKNTRLNFYLLLFTFAMSGML